MIARANTTKRMSKAEMAALVARANAAGMAAGEAARPEPMVVVEAEGLSNAPKIGGKSWTVPGGVCGFAWVKITPATTRFARWAKKAGIGRKAYGGGLSIWVGAFGQSMERKVAYARAYAEVLRAEGIRAYAESRMD